MPLAPTLPLTARYHYQNQARAQALPIRPSTLISDSEKQRLLDIIYSDLDAGYTTESKDPNIKFRMYDKLSSIGINPLTGFPPPCTGGTYGEITRDGIETLAVKLGLDRNPATVFYDLGSGAGKAVMHMAVAEYARDCKGVELSKLRNDQALKLQDQTINSATSSDTKNRLKNHVKFSLGDLRDADLSDASVVWSANLCFPESVNVAIGKTLGKLPNLEAVASLEEIPGLEDDFSKQSVDLPCSWERMEVYLYRRKSGKSGAPVPS
uniref:Histone-lysine N-methyltransferase, H3 lysine-79 specific n=2 Tax=Amorphochlora amoebiformis TaxID=1561963 RepID=A0A7S0H1H3_9EUKA|mmetsp:Transcript_3465/g.5290  ORF Transcript_3465/g.5290 Transcript_3465/m.5290 type:complete len:266 (+) Transcript_3465:286-1083(+)